MTRFARSRAWLSTLVRVFRARPLWLLAALAGSPAGAAPEPAGPMKAAVAARLEGTITVDGRLDEPAWQKAPLHTGFEMPLGQANRKPIPEDAQTSFRVLCDDGSLYFGIRCNEPRPADLVSEAARQHDAAMWSDDDVEIFLDPVGDRTEYYQLTINSEGTQADLYYIEGGNTNKAAWSSVWPAAVLKGPDFWSVEVALPFALFSNRPSRMWADKWVFSMSRSRSVSPGYYSQFCPANRYLDIKNWGTLEGLKPDKALFNLIADSPLFRLEPAATGYAVFASLVVENRGDEAFDGALSMEILAPGARSAKVPLKLAPNAKARVAIPGAGVSEQGKWPVVFRAERAGGPTALVTRFDNWLTYTPLAIRLTQPGYRNCIYATQKVDTIKGVLTAGMPLEQIQGLIARVTLSSALVAPRIWEKPIDALRLTFELPAQDLPEGRHTLRAELLKPVANPKPGADRYSLVAEKEIVLRKLPPAPAVETRVDDQGNLIVDGNPVFIRGWYGSMFYVGSTAAFPQAQLPHSTNFMMGASDYETSNLGLYTLVGVTREIDEAKAKLDRPIDDALKARLRAAIAGARANRRVIGYYISDEPECRGLSPYFLRSLYEFMAEEDPYRFCKIVSRAPVEYMDACDVMCPHPYMSPQLFEDGTRTFGSPVRAIHNNITDACAANDGSKAIWSMPQTFSYGGLRGQHPTFRESRWFVYTSLACGAKGMVPFIFNGFWNHLESRIALNTLFEDLTFLAPAWLARDSATEATADNTEVDVCAKAYRPEGAARAHTFIVAANQSYKAGKATISVPALAKSGSARLIVLRENRALPVADGKFTDQFDGLGVHVYTTLEVVPHFRTLDEVDDEITTRLERPAKEGNLLADGKTKWWLGEPGQAFSSDLDLADGARDASGWLPWYGDRTQCVLVFDKPVTFARVEFYSPSIAAADLDIWQDGKWQTIHQWKDQYLHRLEWKGRRVRADRVRIRPTAARAGFGSTALYEITELGIYR